MDKLEYYNHFFGYAKYQNRKTKMSENNEFDPLKLEFYDYGINAKKENKEAYLDFINVNEEMFKLRLDQ